MLNALYRAEADGLTDLLGDVPESTQTRLAVYLYGRSHTHDLSLRIAAPVMARRCAMRLRSSVASPTSGLAKSPATRTGSTETAFLS